MSVTAAAMTSQGMSLLHFTQLLLGHTWHIVHSFGTPNKRQTEQRGIRESPSDDKSAREFDV